MEAGEVGAGLPTLAERFSWHGPALPGGWAGGPAAAGVPAPILLSGSSMGGGNRAAAARLWAVDVAIKVSADDIGSHNT